MALIDINWNPSKRELRGFAGMLLVFFGGIGAYLLYSGWQLSSVAWIWLPAGFVGVLGLIAPRAIRYVFVGWIVAAFPIGWTISHLLLGLIYYTILTPLGLAMRVVGYDPMKRRLEPDAQTYWMEHRSDQGVARYFRQF